MRNLTFVVLTSVAACQPEPGLETRSMPLVPESEPQATGPIHPPPYLRLLFNRCGEIVLGVNCAGNADSQYAWRRPTSGVWSFLEPICQSGFPVDTLTDNDVLPGSTWCYRTTAHNETHERASNEICVEAVTCPTPAPKLSALEALPTSVMLGVKDQADNEQGHRLYKRQGVNWLVIHEYGPKPGTGTLMVHLDNGLIPGGIYRYRASSFNQYGEAFSPVLTVHTPPSDVPIP